MPRTAGKWKADPVFHHVKISSESYVRIERGREKCSLASQQAAKLFLWVVPKPRGKTPKFAQLA
jgi:hypothetical protein